MLARRLRSPAIMRIVMCLLPVTLLPGSLMLLAGGAALALRPSLPAFRPAEEAAAFEYLQRSAAPGEVALAAYETGNALPAWAPAFVVIGHGVESAGLARLRGEVAAFYDPATTEEQRLALLAESGARFLFWGPAERRLGGWNPGEARFLRPIFRQGEYALFAVEPAAADSRQPEARRRELGHRNR